ncbi:2-oxoglutarate and iron-dependent oxygenase domain-containing protein [Streptomyces clavuligerus]|uniref:2-oxoglutarate-dependent ethylene/succinate-forming enzyme n=1 Tax=Streptomyces clavuligerus TaxID=1901 RepID=B5H325_STRCL|nr:2-oxoglutarate and iron-dependent oxygenase domain-containing protein [Streptomyces clavuligerus]ANW21549.1 tungsten formylmethanofuran dehydrogenase [Streptomyces clavuligerus]AXU16179.1 isopenicillin N synthase family oxygenase [Streptomyces clavuligerus]EDY52971.1 2-oxoglutarate-dependent ethylene/succinate-forming enzyme [Streptomyces clavuligerus]EFG05284.1 2-oxoglutarate-dependent ethylene/succinate-forming enzyme [Streptomyces clavuligerus]MBY6306329.1 isopenicillin N synthase family
MSVLPVFELPDAITGASADRALGTALIDAWLTHGVFRLAISPAQRVLVAAALRESRRFFHHPLAYKKRHVNDLTYSGYIAPDEEPAPSARGLPETFAVGKDVPADDQRALSRWPCHGPVPWPGASYRRSMRALLTDVESQGERLLALIALGLGLEDPSALNALTHDGWHHMRVLRFPPVHSVAGYGPGPGVGSDSGTGFGYGRRSAADPGIGSPLDHGLLTITAQDDAGGIWVRPPAAGKPPHTTGPHEPGSSAEWTLTPPVPSALTVLPGPVLHLLTSGHLPSTPHRVQLADHDRHVISYIHEPNFQALVQPLRHTRGDRDPLATDEDRRVHYGTHVTSMLMRCYPERLTTRRLREDGGLARLARLRAGAGLD